ncbi:MAG TPA: phage tail tape measure protein, partial [bacterium]|nr:phage tail tape measure protein [bacterium]
MADQLAELFVEIELSNKKLLAQLKAMEKTSTKTKTKMQKILNSVNFSKIGSSIDRVTNKILRWGSVTGVVIAGLGIRKATRDFAELETALVDTQKVTTQSIDKIRKAVSTIDTQLGASVELVKGYYQVISAGVTKPKKALDLLTIASKASKASHVDQSEVIKGLTKLMAGYEGKIRDVTEASDALFAIEKIGQTTFAEIIPLIGSLAKLSSDLSINIDELGGSFATVTQTAGNTAEASTRMRALMISLIKPTKNMTALLKSWGFASSELAIKQLGFLGLLRKIETVTGGSAAELGKLFEEQRAILGLSGLLSQNLSVVTRNVELMGDKTGKTAAAYKLWTTTLAASGSKLSAILRNVAALAGAGLAPVLKEWIALTGEWVVGNEKFIGIKVAEWAIKTKDSLKNLFDFVSKNKDGIILAFELMFGAAVVVKIAKLTSAIALFIPSLAALSGGIIPVAIGAGIVALTALVLKLRKELKATDEIKLNKINDKLREIAKLQSMIKDKKVVTIDVEASGIVDLTARVKVLNEEIADIEKHKDIIARVFEQGKVEIESITKTVVALKNIMNSVESVTVRTVGSFLDWVNQATGSLSRFKDSGKPIISMFNELETNYKGLAAEVLDSNSTLEKNIEIWDKLRSNSLKTSRALDFFKSSVEDAANQGKTFNEIWETFGKNITKDSSVKTLGATYTTVAQIIDNAVTRALNAANKLKDIKVPDTGVTVSAPKVVSEGERELLNRIKTLNIELVNEGIDREQKLEKLRFKAQTDALIG